MPSTMRLIAKTTLGSSQASVTFDNITQTHTDLVVAYSARSDRSGAINDAVYMRLNGSTSNFSVRFLEGNGSSVSSSTASVGFVGQATAATATANTFGSNQIYIPNYAGSSNKAFSVDGAQETNAAGAIMDAIAGLWSNTAPITSLSLYPSLGSNFLAGSSFFLYGVTSAAGSIPGVFGVDATGGDVTISGGFKYHVFRSSGQLTVAQPGWAEVLVVAGGGGGGFEAGGGGGAGGVLTSSRYVAPGTYVVAVGAGGPGGASSGLRGDTGSNSTITSLEALGGGGGGSFNDTTRNGLNGGSGGGSSGRASNADITAGGSGTAGQGFAGGSGRHVTGSYLTGGGGGGSGGVGQDYASNKGGNGGPGVAVWGSTYGGGGGAGASANTGAAGGSGGSGSGGNGAGVGSTSATAGAVNTGGGGGGGCHTPTSAGAAGGSGIVIIRYPVT